MRNTFFRFAPIVVQTIETFVALDLPVLPRHLSPHLLLPLDRYLSCRLCHGLLAYFQYPPSFSRLVYLLSVCSPLPVVWKVYVASIDYPLF